MGKYLASPICSSFLNYFEIVNIESIIKRGFKDNLYFYLFLVFTIAQIQIFFDFKRAQQMDVEKSQFQRQLDKLLQKQKIARINNDHPTSVNLLKQIITVCYKAQQFDKLKEMIDFLMGRRGQSKKAQIQMIQLAMSWLHDTAQPQRTKLIETIRDVTAKKIYLQVQYARCILMIVKAKQSDDNILQAAKILQQVQVETYGSMDRRQKLEFIMYQMKIMIKKEDYVRLFIISKKINENNINDDSIADIKIDFYSYLAIYHNHQHNFYEAARCYRIIWETLQTTKKIIPETLGFNFSTNINHVLGNYVGFLVLEAFSEKCDKELKQLKADQRLEKYASAHHLIQSFLADQIVPCNLQNYNLSDFPLFVDGFQNAKKHREELLRMLVQHNVRIISRYYGRITLQRISSLNGVAKDYCEEQLCALNNRKVIGCRIDRIDDTVGTHDVKLDFRPLQNEDRIVSNWNQSINGILDLVDEAANLIHREREVYRK